jgi:hypothetical protein
MTDAELDKLAAHDVWSRAQPSQPSQLVVEHAAGVRKIARVPDMRAQHQDSVWTAARGA